MSSDSKAPRTIAELLSMHGGSIKTGPFGTALKASEYATEGVPLISVREIGNGTFHIDSKTPRVGAATLARLPEYILAEGDIVFARKGGIERCALIRKQHVGWFLGSDGIRLRPPKSCDARYLAYSLQTDTVKEWLLQHSTGSTMASLNQSTIGRLPVELPILSEQVLVADTLELLDDRIVLLRDANTTLEAIAQTLFKSWFVDFDPVRAKMEGRAPEGMDECTAELFPASFEESELGSMPKGWRPTRLDALCTFQKGCSYKGAGLSDDEGAFMFNLGCFNSPRTFAFEKIKRYTGEYKERHVVHAGDLILGNTDMTQARDILGRPLIVPAGYDRAFISHHVFKVDFKDDSKRLLRNFLFFTFGRPAFRDRAVGYATGTTVLALPKDALNQHQIVVPDIGTLEAFNEICEPVLLSMEKNLRAIQTLSTLRDTLLPRLISGQLRLPDTQISVAEGAMA